MSVSPMNLFLVACFSFLGFWTQDLVPCHAWNYFNKWRALNINTEETTGIVILSQERIFFSEVDSVRGYLKSFKNEPILG